MCSFISNLKTSPPIRTAQVYKHEVYCTRINTLYWSVVVLVIINEYIFCLPREAFSETIKVTAGMVCVKRHYQGFVIHVCVVLNMMCVMKHYQGFVIHVCVVLNFCIHFYATTARIPHFSNSILLSFVYLDSSTD